MAPAGDGRWVGSFGDQPTERQDCAPLIRDTAQAELDGLYRFAVARVGNSQDAQDALQQALVIALAHASPPDDEIVQRAWLRGILRNVIRREARTRGRGRRAMERFAGHSRGDREEPAAPPANREERAALVRRLFLAITELDRSDQDLFYEFYRAGRSQASIARDMGTTPKSVEVRLYRLRARLRTAMGSCAESKP